MNFGIETADTRKVCRDYRLQERYEIDVSEREVGDFRPLDERRLVYLQEL